MTNVYETDYMSAPIPPPTLQPQLPPIHQPSINHDHIIELLNCISSINSMLNKKKSLITHLDLRKKVYKIYYFLYDTYVNNIMYDIITIDNKVSQEWNVLIRKMNEIKKNVEMMQHLNIHELRIELFLIVRTKNIYDSTYKHIIHYITTEDSMELKPLNCGIELAYEEPSLIK